MDSPEDKDKELIESVQRGVKAWREIVQFTGGMAMKCSLFLLTYNWPNGRARLKTMNDLVTPPHEVVVETPAGEEDNVHPSHVKIPQPNGIDLPIRTHELEDAVKMLGFYQSFVTSKIDHVKELIKKGVDWVDRMKRGKLPMRDALMSLFAQLLPGINWGLVTVVITPQALHK